MSRKRPRLLEVTVTFNPWTPEGARYFKAGLDEHIKKTQEANERVKAKEKTAA